VIYTGDVLKTGDLATKEIAAKLEHTIGTSAVDGGNITTQMYILIHTLTS